MPEVIGSDGQVDKTIATAVKPDGTDTYSVTATPPAQFRPGKYTLSVSLKDGNSSNTLTQDFTWGVLAINPNKSIYAPGEKADLSIGVLDPAGNMICNASLTLTITDPKGTVTTLQTSDNSIAVQPGCLKKDMILIPDYEALYTVHEAGTYAMTLRAETKAGTFTINDHLEVDPTAAFSVERQTATRIYPLNTYPVSLIITPKQDFTGDIVESVPQSFAVSQLAKSEVPYTADTTLSAEKKLTWHVSVKQGQPITLGYVYDAPDISPDFFLLGPLRFMSNGQDVFHESRRWQIAVDAVTDLGVVMSGISTGLSDRLEGFKRTSGDTFGAGYDIFSPGDSSSIYHVRALTSTHRSQEIIVTALKANGQLYAYRCNGLDCDASGDWTVMDLDSGSVNNYVAISPAMSCGDTTTGGCERDYDLAEEALGGRVMIVYGKSGAGNQGKIFYQLWDGSSMSAESSFTFNNGSSVDTKWVRTIADPHSNRILVLAEDGNGTPAGLYAMIWDGSTFGNLATMSTNLAESKTPGFDGAFESVSGDILVTWGEGGASLATNPIRYKTYSGGR